MQTVLLTGGTGLVGRRLTEKLQSNGFRVIILSRSPEPGTNVEYARWNIEKKEIDEWALKEADIIIHLAGENIAAKRWSKARKNALINSRVDTALFLYECLKKIPNNVTAFISASGVGWYGSDKVAHKAGSFVETDPPANDFIGNLCKEWESAVKPIESLVSRLVIFRLGVVLSKDGGFLKEFHNKVKNGIAPILGSGNQIISWIHIDDLVRMMMDAIKDNRYTGVFNATAPFPVSQKYFITRLAERVKGKFYIPAFAPKFVLKIMLGELSSELLKSTTVSSQKISSFFQFQFPTILATLDNFFPKKK